MELDEKVVKGYGETGETVEKGGVNEYNVEEIPVLKHDGLKMHPQPTSDPLDPLNWTSLRKHSILAIVMALYFMFTAITTITVPSFPELQTQYNASLSQINWTVAIPALGLAIGEQSRKGLSVALLILVRTSGLVLTSRRLWAKTDIHSRDRHCARCYNRSRKGTELWWLHGRSLFPRLWSQPGGYSWSGDHQRLLLRIPTRAESWVVGACD